MIKLCKNCGKEFETKTRQQYCQDCLTGKDACPICGKDKPILRRFCSQTCVCVWQKSQPGYKNPFSEDGFNKRVEAQKIEEYGSREAYYKHRTEVTQKTNLEIWGTVCPLQNEEIAERSKKTNLALYGVENGGGSTVAQEKIKKSMIKKYGSHYFSTSEFQNKRKQSAKETYGVDDYNKSPIIRNKTKNTCMELYGGPAPACDKNIVDKVKQTQTKLYGGLGFGSEKIKEKILNSTKKKYGKDIDNISEVQDILDLKVKNSIDKYGVAHPSQRNYPEFLKRATYDKEYLISLVGNILYLEDLYSKYGDDAHLINYLLPKNQKLFMKNPPRSGFYGWSGEIKTSIFLDKNAIDYIHEYAFSDLYDVGKLRFDFAVMEHDFVICLIEFQGQQHYGPYEYFGGEETFKNQQLHDQMKRDYCKKHNIPLIEIPYWEEPRLEEFLTEELIKLNILHNKEERRIKNENRS